MMTGESSSAWNNQPIEFTVEKWQEIWGEIDHIRWCEIKPDIPNKEADDSDCVYYGDSIVLGNWTGPLTGFGWGWDGNHKDMSEGTLRYRVHVENRDLFGNLLQEATTPRGIDLFRVSVKGNYPTSEIVEWASSYLGVPFVFGIYNPHNWYDPAPNEYGQGILKHLHKGYEGLECSGLAGWAYVWVGEDLRPEYEEDSVDIVMTGATKLKELYGKANQEPDSARDGDMWFINTDIYPDMEHVGIYVEIANEKGIIHASHQSYVVGEPGDMVVKRTLERSEWIDRIDWLEEDFGGLGRKPHN